MFHKIFVLMYTHTCICGRSSLYTHPYIQHAFTDMYQIAQTEIM